MLEPTIAITSQSNSPKLGLNKSSAVIASKQLVNISSSRKRSNCVEDYP